ncbi:hypothetical protein Csp1_25570 [Corynebacterium provencense]|uniref:Uncharacterized protein n=1 Tax=Corynebacterium provencense TaxID=1737425 RepID=A0A2Z3YPA3_9CORY|nr:hypothetical protein Csp1_25570 [Corynebacterium provencense]
MTPNEKAPVSATNTDQGTENLCTGLSTSNDTRTSTKTGNRRRRPLTFHLPIREDDRVTETYCGKVFPKSGVIRKATSEVRDTPIECTNCRAMYELDRELKAQEDRRRRAETIADMVMRHLEEGDA